MHRNSRPGAAACSDPRPGGSPGGPGCPLRPAPAIRISLGSYPLAGDNGYVTAVD